MRENYTVTADGRLVRYDKYSDMVKGESNSGYWREEKYLQSTTTYDERERQLTYVHRDLYVQTKNDKNRNRNSNIYSS